MSLMNMEAKILNKILAICIQQYVKRLHTIIKWDSSQEYKDFSISENQSTNVIQHVRKLKHKNYVVISIDAKNRIKREKNIFKKSPEQICHSLHSSIIYDCQDMEAT